MRERKTSVPGEESQGPQFLLESMLQRMSAASLSKADLLAAHLVVLSRRPKRGIAKVWTQKKESPIPRPHLGTQGKIDTQRREAGLGTAQKQGSPQVGAVSNRGFQEEHPSETGH